MHAGAVQAKPATAGKHAAGTAVVLHGGRSRQPKVLRRSINCACHAHAHAHATRLGCLASGSRTLPSNACCGNVTCSVPPTRVERVAGQLHYLAVLEHRLPCLGALRKKRKEESAAPHQCVPRHTNMCSHAPRCSPVPCLARLQHHCHSTPPTQHTVMHAPAHLRHVLCIAVVSGEQEAATALLHRIQ